jgi:hypothetical protein
MRRRPGLRDPVKEHVDLLVIERDQPRDRQQLPGQEIIGPRQVGAQLIGARN